MLNFAFMHPPYLVRILFGMPSLHLFTFLIFLSLVCVFFFLNINVYNYNEYNITIVI